MSEGPCLLRLGSIMACTNTTLSLNLEADRVPRYIPHTSRLHIPISNYKKKHQESCDMYEDDMKMKEDLTQDNSMVEIMAGHILQVALLYNYHSGNTYLAASYGVTAEVSFPLQLEGMCFQVAGGGVSQMKSQCMIQKPLIKWMGIQSYCNLT